MIQNRKTVHLHVECSSASLYSFSSFSQVSCACALYVTTPCLSRMIVWGISICRIQNCRITPFPTPQMRGTVITNTARKTYFSRERIRVRRFLRLFGVGTVCSSSWIRPSGRSSCRLSSPESCRTASGYQAHTRVQYTRQRSGRSEGLPGSIPCCLYYFQSTNVQRHRGKSPSSGDTGRNIDFGTA